MVADFESRNCRRELNSALEKELLLVLVRETDAVHGGLSLAELKHQCPPEMRERVFKYPHIGWQRIKDFQLVSLRWVGEALLRALLRPPAVDGLTDSLIIAGSLSEQALILPAPIQTSTHNPGAGDLSQEIQKEAGGKIGNKPPCFLLLLNATTYDDPDLVGEIVQVLEGDQRLILVHDVNISFSDIMERTPPQLSGKGMYNELAVALLDGEHRHVSLIHIAAKMASAPTSQPRVAASLMTCCNKVLSLLDSHRQAAPMDIELQNHITKQPDPRSSSQARPSTLTRQSTSSTRGSTGSLSLVLGEELFRNC